MPSGTRRATSGASRTGGFAVPSTNPVMSRPSRYANPTCSKASSATSSTARATARAWSHTLSGALPLIQSQASCGVAGARRPSIPSSPGKSASDVGRLRRRDLAPGGGAEPGHDVHAARRNLGSSQPPERGDGLGRLDPRPKVELEKVMRVGSLREDPELRERERHGLERSPARIGTGGGDRMEPEGGFEPPTYHLRGGCSAPELLRRRPESTGRAVRRAGTPRAGASTLVASGLHRA